MLVKIMLTETEKRVKFRTTDYAVPTDWNNK